MQVRAVLGWTEGWAFVLSLPMCVYGTPFLNSLVHAGPYVKVQLMSNQRKWKKRKTSCKKGTATPYFNEAFTFLVPFGQLQVGSRKEGQGGLDIVLGQTENLFPSVSAECGPGAGCLGSWTAAPG